MQRENGEGEKKGKRGSMKQIAISACFGGFGISTAGTLLLRELENPWALRSVLKGEYYPKQKMLSGRIVGPTPSDYDYNSYCDEIPRDDQDLISLIQLCDSPFMSGSYCKLKIVEIPNDVAYHIHEYDGFEHVAENHRTWG